MDHPVADQAVGTRHSRRFAEFDEAYAAATFKATNEQDDLDLPDRLDLQVVAAAGDRAHPDPH